MRSSDYEGFFHYGCNAHVKRSIFKLDPMKTFSSFLDRNQIFSITCFNTKKYEIRQGRSNGLPEFFRRHTQQHKISHLFLFEKRFFPYFSPKPCHNLKTNKMYRRGDIFRSQSV